MAITRIHSDPPRREWIRRIDKTVAIVWFIIGLVLGNIFFKNLRIASELAEVSKPAAALFPYPGNKFRDNVQCGDLINHSGEHSIHEFSTDLQEGCWTVVAHPVNWAEFTEEWDGGQKGDWAAFKVEPNTRVFGPYFYPQPFPDFGEYWQAKMQGRGRIKCVRNK